MSTHVLAMSPRNWLQLLSLSILWGGSFFFIEVAVESLPPLTIAWLRVAIAAAVIWLLLIVRRRVTGSTAADAGRVPAGTLLGTFAFMGLVNNVVPFSLIAWGQTQIASSLAAILNATTPLFTALIAHVFLSDERLGLRKLGGILLAILGVMALFDVFAHTRAAGEASAPDWLAKAAILGAACCYGIAAVFGRRFQRLGISPLIGAGGQLTASTLWLLPVIVWVDKLWTLPAPAPAVLAAIVLLGIVSTALAYLLYFTILQSAGATNIALVTLLVPVSATALGVLVLGERLAGAQWFGMALILLGLLVTDGRLLRRLAAFTTRYRN